MRRKVGVVVAVCAALAAITGGIWLMGRDSSSDTLPESPPSANTPDTSPTNVADFPTFRMVIPEGWERLQEREGEDGAILFLRGPAAGDTNLVFAANVVPVAKGVTLNGFMSNYTSDWPIQEFPLNEDIKLCDQDAHIIGFTNGDGDNLVLFCIYKQAAHIIVMVAPSATMPQYINTFYSVVAQMQLYE